MSEAWICDAVRTPIGSYGGRLSSVRPDDLCVPLIQALRERYTQIDWGELDEVVLGCANQAGEDNRNIARMVTLISGLSESVAALTVNRLCASGADAVANVARSIQCGEAELCLAGGVESMSRAPFVMPKSEHSFERKAELVDSTLGWRFPHPEMKARFGIDSMPQTGENVAEQFAISREDQDEFAYRSQLRTERAERAGFFAEEIVEILVPQRRQEALVMSKDEQPRGQTSLEGLAKLNPFVRPDGTITAGNACGINDGACALLIASDQSVNRHGLQPLARIVGSAVIGVRPNIMGIGPAPATRRLLDRTGVKLSEVDFIELNEAFASQCLAVLRELGIPDDADFVNPNGGAIALGHPLGMSGARLVATAARHLKRTGGRYALCTMCVGVGQGFAILIERP
ncbi:3-oxoadipyl-CoA thiolase [Akkermansiaceae bacterium]|nr:3-oxoadipyl-CoA thiolase [Akkermansiaceae bacterium]MDA7612426.1 3-oxoadipyl-CoA thiolase [bacterium]MDA7508567.1 3-oxoadipyl-CoA thiolase [Akkermansiaceae bacterium]MDA7645807.1 3-oxoadipyl-CoA thiolase [bacterium]MDA7649670.1 3-oxoadipyl-CoA thiolase [bacterium]